MRPRLLFIVAAAFCGLLFLAEAASADDCDKLVKGIKDLADKGKLQDCVRTGGKWGKVVGVVVGGTGGAIAAGGVRGNGQGPAGEPPCAQVARLQEELRKKSASLQKLHEEVTEGWKRRMRAQEHLRERWQALKDTESSVMAIYNWTKVRQHAKLAVAAYGLVRAIIAMRAARAAYAGSAALGAATPAVAEKLTETELLLLFAGIKDFSDIDKISDYWQGFMGSKDVQKMWDDVLQQARQYQADANAFNREFHHWAETKAAQLRAAYADLAATYQQLDSPFRECMKYAPPSLDQFMQASDQITEIPVHEAQTSLAGSHLPWLIWQLTVEVPTMGHDWLTSKINEGLRKAGHTGPLPTGRPPGTP